MDDDTLLDDPQAREDTFLALLAAGLVPNVKPHVLARAEDLSAFYARLEESPASSRFVLQVPKMLALKGQRGGAMLSGVIAGFPKNLAGRVALAFEGWLGDHRALHEVPEISDFCYGLLLGPEPSTPDPRYAQSASVYLLREWEMKNPSAPDATGCLWVTGVAFSERVYEKTDSGWARDLDLEIFLLTKILKSSKTGVQDET